MIKENFETLINILKYNCRNNIYFYRLTSKLIPLATHKNINIDYINNYRKLYNQAAILMKNMRVDVHPEQFVVLNSTKKDFRSHSEYINCFEFIGFIEAIKDYNTDIDIMLEAKGKDEAIFRLTRQLKFMTDY